MDPDSVFPERLDPFQSISDRIRNHDVHIKLKIVKIVFSSQPIEGTYRPCYEFKHGRFIVFILYIKLRGKPLSSVWKNKIEIYGNPSCLACRDITYAAKEIFKLTLTILKTSIYKFGFLHFLQVSGSDRIKVFLFFTCFFTSPLIIMIVIGQPVLLQLELGLEVLEDDVGVSVGLGQHLHAASLPDLKI